MSNPKATLGQQVFVLSGRNVVRTMVGRIEIGVGRAEIGDRYTFLNGDEVEDPDGFSYDDAVVAARERIKVQKAKLRKALHDLAKEDLQIQTETYRQSVENAPYKMFDLRFEHYPRFRSRMRKNVSVPETYLVPGQRVYAIITPATRPCFDGMTVYRPFRNYVLSTRVKSVCISPNGEAVYAFTTPFVLGEYFLSRKEAMGAGSGFIRSLGRWGTSCRKRKRRRSSRNLPTTISRSERQPGGSNRQRVPSRVTLFYFFEWFPRCVRRPVRKVY